MQKTHVTNGGEEMHIVRSIQLNMFIRLW